MSGWGTFYEIPDSAREALTGLAKKSAWYNALGMLALDAAPHLDTQQALHHGWIGALEGQEGALGRLFTGDLRTPEDGTGDPAATFLGQELVAVLAAALARQDEAHFLDLLGAWHADASRQIWLLAPLRAFFAEAARHGSAVILLWGD